MRVNYHTPQKICNKKEKLKQKPERAHDNKPNGWKHVRLSATQLQQKYSEYKEYICSLETYKTACTLNQFI
jgi:hypothetical protein